MAKRKELTDVLDDLSKQTEMAVKDDRIPIDPDGLAEWVKQIIDLEKSGKILCLTGKV